MPWPQSQRLADRTVLRTFGSRITFRPADADPSEEVTLTPAGAPLLGVFSRSYNALDTETGASVGVNKPNVCILLEDFPSRPVSSDDGTGDGLTIDGTRYTIRAVEDDGMGGARLVLHQESA